MNKKETIKLAKESDKFLEDKLSSMEVERKELLKTLRSIRKKIITNYNLLSELREIKASKTIDEFGDEPIWEFILKGDTDSKIIHDYQQKFLRSMGLARGGYNSNTNEVSLQVWLTKGDKELTKKHLDGFYIMLPHLTPIDDYIKVSIMEEACAANGSYSLLIGQNHCYIERMYYHKPEQIAEFSTLESALEYIEDKLYYDVKEK